MSAQNPNFAMRLNDEAGHHRKVVNCGDFLTIEKQLVYKSRVAYRNLKLILSRLL